MQCSNEGGKSEVLRKKQLHIDDLLQKSFEQARLCAQLCSCVARWIIRKWDGEARTGLIWLRTGTGCGLL